MQLLLLVLDQQHRIFEPLAESQQQLMPFVCCALARRRGSRLTPLCRLMGRSTWNRLPNEEWIVADTLQLMLGWRFDGVLALNACRWVQDQ